jgi:hypothetical protein
METGEPKGYRTPRNRQLGIRMDAALEDALEASALKNERRLAQEARFAIRKYLGLDQAPAEDKAGVA